MSVIEEPPANAANGANGASGPAASAAKPVDSTTSGPQPPAPADNLADPDAADHAVSVTSDSEHPEGNPVSQAQTAAPNPFADSQVVHPAITPDLPPRPDHDEPTMATTTIAAAAAAPEHPAAQGVDATAQEEPLSPQVEALRAMFPDFDTVIL